MLSRVSARKGGLLSTAVFDEGTTSVGKIMSFFVISSVSLCALDKDSTDVPASELQVPAEEVVFVLVLLVRPPRDAAPTVELHVLLTAPRLSLLASLR